MKNKFNIPKIRDKFIWNADNNYINEYNFKLSNCSFITRYISTNIFGIALTVRRK